MLTRLFFVALFAVSICSVAVAKEERWYNFAEDGDLRYYIDQKSMLTRDSDIHIFWVKSVAKNKEYYKEEYNLNNLSYILTSYELDCSDATYRVRQMLMMDRNRRELNRSAPAGAETDFEPIPPESALELAQEMVCPKGGSTGAEDTKESSPAPALAPAAPAEPPASAQPEAEPEEAPGAEPAGEPGIQ